MLENATITTTTCLVCRHESHGVRIRAREMMLGLRNEFEYFECASCGCLQLLDRPEDMSRYYPANYYSMASGGKGRVLRGLKRRRAAYALTGKGLVGRALCRVFGQPDYAEWTLRAGVNFSSAILDVGSGTGRLLLEMAEAGFTNLTGIDPFMSKDVAYENGVKVLKQEISEVQGSFDLVMLHHSLEHMDNPREVLAHVYRLLRPNSVAIVRTPVADSFAWRHYRANWVQLDAPRHLFVHTRRSMEILASQTGLSLIYAVCDSNEFQLWGSEHYLRDISLTDAYSPKQGKSTFSRHEVQVFRERTRELNSLDDGDAVAFYFRKG